MFSKSRVKHAIHVVTLFGFILAFELNMGCLRFYRHVLLEATGGVNIADTYDGIIRTIILHSLNIIGLLNLSQSIVVIMLIALLNPLLGYIEPIGAVGIIRTILLWVLRFSSLTFLPIVAFNTLGLTLLNTFPDKVQLKKSPKLAPFICIRVVTRGDYPGLIRDNFKINMEICQKVGLENFRVEVVTDKHMDLPNDPRLRQVVVPDNYRTKSNSLFKARALQYCLEEGVDILQDNDWIVHLDEETLLTEDAIRGILNFCTDGRYHFGQGVITYANGQIVNWFTTLSDSLRVADDIGRIRFQFRYFHRPLFGWKGSYMVAQAEAERLVSFDHGPDGSIAEDYFFAMVAFQKGYRFNFIEGDMHEKSPFTLWDYVRQRKRYVQGFIAVVVRGKIPIRLKILVALTFYSWATMPFSIAVVSAVGATGPFPPNTIFDSLGAFSSAVVLYMSIFGTVKQFSNRYGPASLMVLSLGALCSIPVKIILECVSVIWGLFGKRHEFYVIQKVLVAEATEV